MSNTEDQTQSNPATAVLLSDPELVPASSDPNLLDVESRQCLQYKLETGETDSFEQFGRYPVSNNTHTFSLNRPGSNRCFLPLEQPFHKPQIQIVPTQTYAVDSPEAKLPKKPQSQQQMFSTRKAEMISSPNGRSAAGASASCTSVSHGTGHADGAAGDKQEGCSRVSPVDLHGISPDHG